MVKNDPKSDTHELDHLLTDVVALYLTEDTGLPCNAKGYQISSLEVQDSEGARVERLALRVTFETSTSTKEPRHLLTFGSDDQRCNVILNATEASPIHCRIYAQLNSGSNIWVLEDISNNGTEYLDEEALRTRISKNVARGRVAVQGLCRIRIGRNIFSFLSPSDSLERSQRERYFRSLDPIPVTQEMLQNQLGELSPDYSLVRMVGHGGMAKVFQYIEKTTGLMVAVKEEKVKSKDADDRIRREIHYMQSLKHPNLVEYISSNFTNAGVKKWFTAMPLYQGRLRDILPLGIPAIENVMLQLFEAVAYMHSQRILHKDIKPDNVLVKGKLRPDIVLADYGLCASLNNRAELVSSSGTLGYSAPEVSRMIVQTEAVDVFALGATLFFILEPERCIGTSATLETLRNVMRRPPKVYAGLVQSMMAHDAQERPSLKECFEVVKARLHDWRKMSPLASLLSTVPSTPEPRRSLRIQKAGAQELPKNTFAKIAARRPWLTPIVEDRRPQKRSILQQARQNDFKVWDKLGAPKGGKRLIPPPAPVHEPQAPAPVQRVDFAAPPPPNPKAPFADPNRALDTAARVRPQAAPATPAPARTLVRTGNHVVKRKIRRHPERRKMVERWQNLGIHRNKICHAVGEVASGTPLNALRGLFHLTVGGIGLTHHFLGLIFRDIPAANDALYHISPESTRRNFFYNTDLHLMCGLKSRNEGPRPMTPEEYEAERLQSVINFRTTKEGKRFQAWLENQNEKVKQVAVEKELKIKEKEMMDKEKEIMIKERKLKMWEWEIMMAEKELKWRDRRSRRRPVR